MATLSPEHLRLSYQQVLQAALKLPAAERLRLRAQLSEPTKVCLVGPTVTPSAIRRGRRLAKMIRAELADSLPEGESLEQVMSRLRGSAWS